MAGATGRALVLGSSLWPIATFTITGKPGSRGTDTLTVQVGDQEPGWPGVTAPTTFTFLTVQ